LIQGQDNYMSDTTQQFNKTYIINGQLVDAIRHLLATGWRKKEDGVFYKTRNTYNIELTGTTHPMWNVKVTPKNQEFDMNDWKLRQDMSHLRNLGNASSKKLYLSDENREELLRMMSALRQNQFNLIYDNTYMILRAAPNKIKVFKIAASMELVEQKDGWYVGEKKIL
jgi:hypothetical protein